MVGNASSSFRTHAPPHLSHLYVGEWGAGTLDANLLNFIATGDGCVVNASGNGGITASSAFKIYDAGEAVMSTCAWLNFL